MSITVNMAPYDGVFGIYTGPDCNSLTPVFCQDEPDDPVIWNGPAVGGTTYWFQVGDWGLGEGGGVTDFSLNALYGPGACCFREGGCSDLLPTDCFNIGGTYHGDGTSCLPENPCPQPQPGDLCAVPLIVNLPADLPYTDPNQYTCGRGNDYSGQTTCLGYYAGGEDIIYKLVVSELICVDISVVGADQSNSWLGVAVAASCPPIAPCTGVATSWSTTADIYGLPLPPGEYYMMVDTFPAPNCLTDFTLTIRTATYCPVGACCTLSGCTVEYQGLCAAAGGMWAGPDTVCSTDDCDGNGLLDMCELMQNPGLDCNHNGILDACDLAAHPEWDLDLNGVLDACDADCNQNGVPDVCELPNGCAVGNCNLSPLCGTASDCQEDGIPDSCQLVPAAYEYQVDDGSHEAWIGLRWGGYMAWMNHFQVTNGQRKITDIEIAYGPMSSYWSVTVYLWSDPNQDGDPSDAQVIVAVPTYVANPDQNVLNVVDIPDTLLGPDGTHFFVGAIIQHWGGQSPGSVDMDSSAGESWVVGDTTTPIDPNNLSAAALPPARIDGPSIGMPGNFLIRARALAPAGGDCNQNGIPDICDLDAGVLHDCNNNGVPDECEPIDCNQNHVPDDCDIAGGTSLDCNLNGIPDECETADCNGNGIPDDCDIASGTSWDCNGNSVPDECDIAAGTSHDCNGNTVPDECDITNGTSADCNQNGVPDQCDIASGTSLDCQPDGIPDDCQLGLPPFSEVAEGFEAGSVPPADWTGIYTIPAWSWMAAGGSAHSGQVFAYCSWAPGYWPQNEWLITPEFNIGGPVTVAGWTIGSYYYAVSPEENYDVEAWIIIGPDVNDGDDILLGQIDQDTWTSDWTWTPFSYQYNASASIPFRVAFRYVGAGGADAGLDDITILLPAGAPANDCNQNGVPDGCDITSGHSPDADGNGIPDECEVPPCTLMGDMNLDGTVNALDIQGFVDCVLGAGTNCNCGNFAGSIDVDELDVPGFVAELLAQ